MRETLQLLEINLVEFYWHYYKFHGHFLVFFCWSDKVCRNVMFMCAIENNIIFNVLLIMHCDAVLIEKEWLWLAWRSASYAFTVFNCYREIKYIFQFLSFVQTGLLCFETWNLWNEVEKELLKLYTQINVNIYRTCMYLAVLIDLICETIQ